MKPKHQQLNLFSWIKRPPESQKRIAILVPQFNESGNVDYYNSRLEYFSALASAYRTDMDIILIDDGSADNSLKILTGFQQKENTAFYSACISKNTQKVGALNLTAIHIPHDYVILSDFDTDLTDLQNLKGKLFLLDVSKELIGCYFRMYPFGGLA